MPRDRAAPQRRTAPPDPYRDRLVGSMRELVVANPCRGRRYVIDVLHKERWLVSARLMKRLWRQEALLVPQRRMNRRRIGTGDCETLDLMDPNLDSRSLEFLVRNGPCKDLSFPRTSSTNLRVSKRANRCEVCESSATPVFQSVGSAQQSPESPLRCRVGTVGNAVRRSTANPRHGFALFTARR
jgi:hypothetical protein